ncbi:50S ribosomal protein L23 [Planctomycetales bacterium 10988]|nr:50S ribosomal protein L23 [Planctomycetales bacterium 10988]
MAVKAKAEGKKTKMTLDPHQIILRPIITEKTMHRSQRDNAYTFEVSSLATKDDIRGAVESMFEVKVAKIATQNRRGKSRRVKFRMGKTRNWKKAIITLDQEHRIDFF